MSPKPVTYFVEVYDGRDCLVTFEGKTPFMALAVGDLLNPAGFASNLHMDVQLRAVRIERILWESDAYIGDKVCVYCETITFGDK